MQTRWAVSLPIPPDLAACVARARAAEQRDYESVWIAETSGPDAFVVATAVAGATTRLRIGTAVVPAFTRTAPVLAVAAGSLDQLAPGRFVLGVGASSDTIVEQWSGVPFRRGGHPTPMISPILPTEPVLTATIDACAPRRV